MRSDSRRGRRWPVDVGKMKGRGRRTRCTLADEGDVERNPAGKNAWRKRGARYGGALAFAVRLELRPRPVVQALALDALAGRAPALARSHPAGTCMFENAEGAGDGPRARPEARGSKHDEHRDHHRRVSCEPPQARKGEGRGPHCSVPTTPETDAKEHPTNRLFGTWAFPGGRSGWGPR